MVYFQWRIQEFQNRGRGRILWVWELLWCPFTHTLCFCSESSDWKTNCTIACWLQLKYMFFMQSKLKDIFEQGVARPMRPFLIRLWLSRKHTVNKRRQFNWFCEVYFPSWSVLITKPRKSIDRWEQNYRRYFAWIITVGWFTVIGYGRIYEIKNEIVNTYCFKIFFVKLWCELDSN